MPFGPFLQLEHPINEQSEFLLNLGPNIVGREDPANIILPFPQISRRHARIDYEDFTCFVADLGSTNGTFVNGVQIFSEPVAIEPDDYIVFGAAVTVQFADPSSTPQVQRIGRLKGIWIDGETKTVWVDALPVKPPLSVSQFALLQLLYDANGTVVPRKQIIESVWPEYDPTGISGEAVDGLIKRLRQRLRQTQPNHEYIEVLRGHGLRIAAP